MADNETPFWLLVLKTSPKDPDARKFVIRCVVRNDILILNESTIFDSLNMDPSSPLIRVYLCYRF